MRSEGTAEELKARRKRAIDLLQKGWAPRDVADSMGVTTKTIYAWKAKWKEGGKRALASLPQHVPTCRMSDDQQRELGAILMQGAMVFGYPTDPWTTARIAEVVKKRFKIDYNPDHLGRLLHTLGYSCQKPVKRAKEQDEAAVKRWRQRRLGSYKKRLKNSKLALYLSMNQASCYKLWFVELGGDVENHAC